MARTRSARRTVPTSDGYIAAMAAATGMAVATCDTAPFDAAGLEAIDPWTA